MSVTKNLATDLEHKGINLKDLSRKTNIPYSNVYKSLSHNTENHRTLSADEILFICKHLKLNPFDYLDNSPDKESA